jgi:hypothetical protein
MIPTGGTDGSDPEGPRGVPRCRNCALEDGSESPLRMLRFVSAGVLSRSRSANYSGNILCVFRARPKIGVNLWKCG